MKLLWVLFFISVTANGEILLRDDFEGKTSTVSSWVCLPKGAKIVKDIRDPHNHVMRLTDHGRLVSKPADRFTPDTNNDELLQQLERWCNYRLSFRVRLSHIPRIHGTAKGNHFHLFQFEYLVQPGHNGSNVCRVSSWRINSPNQWLIQGPYVYAGRKAQTYPLSHVIHHFPTPGIKADTQWHEVKVEIQDGHVTIQIDDKKFFDGKHEMNDCGGIAFAATFIPESGIEYIELDNIKVETIGEIK